MSTEKQVLANRLNAQRSTGPRSLQGKTVVSQNAVKHGLSAANTVIADENPADFAIHRDQLLAELAPFTPLESILAQRLVTLSWRLRRASRLHTQTINALHSKNTNSPASSLIKSMMPKQTAGNQIQYTSHDSPDTNLPRTIIKDFSDSRILERLLMYERRIENSLFKTILEIHRLNLIRQITSPTSKQSQQTQPSQP